MSRKRKKKPAAIQPANKLRERIPTLAERVNAERERVFKAMSVVAVVRAACASVDMDRDPEIAEDALQAAYDILNEVAGELQVIRDEHGGVDAELRDARP